MTMQVLGAKAKGFKVFETNGDFPAVGKLGVGYVAKDSDHIYLWDDTTSSYVDATASVTAGPASTSAAGVTRYATRAEFLNNTPNVALTPDSLAGNIKMDGGGTNAALLFQNAPDGTKFMGGVAYFFDGPIHLPLLEQGDVSDKAASTEFVETKFANDLRTGAPGGMRLAGNTAAVPVNGAATDIPVGDFTVAFVVRPAWDDGGNSWLFALSDNFVIGFGNSNLPGLGNSATVSVYQHSVGIYYQAPVGIPMSELVGKWCRFTVSRIGGEWSATFNGSAVVFPDTPPVSSGTSIVTMLGGLFSYGQFQGDAYLVRILNFAMTDAEALGASRNEAVGRLAFKGVNVSNTAFPGGTSTGFTGGSVVGSSFQQSFPLAQGFRVRFSSTGSGQFKLSDIALGVEVSTPVSYSSGASDFTVYGYISVPGGVYFYPDASQTVSGFSVQAIGTVANFPPSKTRRSARWRDNYGDNHLTPVSGAIALDPEDEQPRTSDFRYDLAVGATYTDAEGWAFLKTGTGTFTVTPPSWATLVKIPTATANATTAGKHAGVSVNQTTGVVTITITNAGTPSDDVVYGALNWRE